MSQHQQSMCEKPLPDPLYLPLPLWIKPIEGLEVAHRWDIFVWAIDESMQRQMYGGSLDDMRTHGLGLEGPCLIIQSLLGRHGFKFWSGSIYELYRHDVAHVLDLLQFSKENNVRELDGANFARWRAWEPQSNDSIDARERAIQRELVVRNRGKPHAFAPRVPAGADWPPVEEQRLTWK